MKMTLVDKIRLKRVNLLAPKMGQTQHKRDPDQCRGGHQVINIVSIVELGAKAVLDHQEIHPECDGHPEGPAEAEERRVSAVSER